MGFGRNQAFQDYHNAAAAKDRQEGVYSDDEYENVNKTDKRTKPFSEKEASWQQDSQSQQSQQFWRDVDQNKNKEEFARQMWDEFDEYFQFNDQGPASRDDTKGADYKAEITIEFMDAIKGVKTQVEMDKRMICQTCKGTKAKQGSQPRKCYECGGRGSVIGNYGIRKKCKKCNGAGCIVRVPCNDCEGLGVQRQTIKEDVDLPQGLHDGQKIKVKGFGHASDVFQGIAGDLLLTVNIKPHPIFKRDGLNVYSDVALSLTDAILGCKITIDSIDGKINIELKPGVNDGDEIVLKHKGVPMFQSPEHYDEELLKGDHIVRFTVKIPENLTQKQKDILNQFQQRENENKDKYYESIKQEQMKKDQEKHPKHHHPHHMHHTHQHHHHAQTKPRSQNQTTSNGGGIFGKIKGIFT